jgi:ATP-binding cassette subfamily B protein
MEMRAYNLTDFFRNRFVKNRKQLVGQLLRISRRLGTLDVLCGVIEAAAMFAVVWLLIRQAFAAAISVGTFVMLFEAFRRGQGYLSSLVSSIASLYDNRLFVGNLFDFLDFKPQIVSPNAPTPMPDKIVSIEFRDITFRYPDMEHDVLSHYNLVAKVGEVTRIDGENGYGKSTLVKLLLRLYDPQGGAVLINGIDIRRFSLDELRKNIGVMFQDFGRYSLTARENISFNETADVTDAAILADADSIIRRLPLGYSNMLGRTFDGGAELSMGQWQRLAMARLLYTDAPVMVFDEPVAWIDIAARNHFNETIDKIKTNKIILIITHA